MFDTFLYGLSHAQLVSGDKKRALKAVICLLTFPMHWVKAQQFRLVPFGKKIMVNNAVIL